MLEEIYADISGDSDDGVWIYGHKRILEEFWCDRNLITVISLIQGLPLGHFYVYSDRGDVHPSCMLDPVPVLAEITYIPGFLSRPDHKFDDCTMTDDLVVPTSFILCKSITIECHLCLCHVVTRKYVPDWSCLYARGYGVMILSTGEEDPDFAFSGSVLIYCPKDPRDPIRWEDIRSKDVDPLVRGEVIDAIQACVHGTCAEFNPPRLHYFKFE